MIKYIITKEIEVEESVFDSKQMGVFDTEKEAISFAEVDETSEEQFDNYDNNGLTDPETTIHYCLSQTKDGFRLWVGEDSSRYVDRAFNGKSLGLAFALADWYKKYGQFIEQDWKECFPERNREMYLEHITRQGYSGEEALKILSYLPQTVTDVISVNTSKMIELWKAKAPLVEPYRAPVWKKMILQGTNDIWSEEIDLS